jgi:hypothetical protein
MGPPICRHLHSGARSEHSAMLLKAAQSTSPKQAKPSAHPAMVSQAPPSFTSHRAFGELTEQEPPAQ